MNEAEIRHMVESRHVDVKATQSWFTPAGNRRSSPLYECEIENDYLCKHKTIKARSVGELDAKVRETVAAWDEQEIRKRIVDAKRDAKAQAKAEAERRDAETKALLDALRSLLGATLDVDDRIDWEAERDTRAYPRFSFPHIPKEPAPPELVLPPKPGFTWLFRWRLRPWEARCEEATRAHADGLQRAKREWEAAVRQHETAREAARQKHAKEKQEFLELQEQFNQALQAFRMKFEAGDADAIVEYCSQVLERSQYPECIAMKSTVTFDIEGGVVVVDLDLPSPDAVAAISGYKFVSRGNRVEPVKMKKKEATALYQSVVDQIVLRTIHEIFEGCYVSTVTRVLLNGWATSLDKATGKDRRERVCSVVADRESFETFDLSRIEPAACIKKLSERMGQMHGVSS